MDYQSLIGIFDLQDESQYPIYLVCIAIGILNEASLFPYIVQRIRNPESAKWMFRALLPMIVAATNLVMLQAGYGMHVVVCTVLASAASWLLFGPKQ
jgi:hypothetical protein